MSQNQFLFTLKQIKKNITQKKENIKKNYILENIEETVNNNLQNLSQNNVNNSELPLFIQNHLNENNLTINDIQQNTEDKSIKESIVSDSNNNSTINLTKEKIEDNSQPEQEKTPKNDIKTKKLLTKNRVRELPNNLKTVVFGQDEVIEEIVDVLKVATLNIKINKEKPAGCYLLAGPTGCGKTEIAVSLAKFLGENYTDIPILKINMGEYGMENDVTKLIGAPPGYKGYEESGLLTNFVKANPACVILLDELEKAHASIDKILLSIMDHGTCTDNKGNIVSFKETIIISTSNLGAEIEYEKDFSKEKKHEYRMERIKEGLRPEILNRYDSIFQCNAISLEVYKKILEKFLKSLIISIHEEHKIELSYSEKILNWACEVSYDPAMGGRPARRFIEQIIIKPLADQMINETLDIENNKEIILDLNKDLNVCFKNKKRKILGVMENTSKLLEKIKNSKFVK